VRRSTVLAVVVFVVLLVVVVVVKLRPAARGGERLSLAGLDIEAVDRMSLSSAEGRVELERGGEGWRLASGERAHPAMVERALAALSRIDTVEVVTTSRDRHAQLGVDLDHGLLVGLWSAGEAAAELVVGPAAAGGSHLRRSDGDSVFRVSLPLHRLLPVDVGQWSELKLVVGGLEDVRRLEVRLVGERPWAVVPPERGKEWRLEDLSLVPDGFRFDGLLARLVVGSAMLLKASRRAEIAVDDPAAGLSGAHDVVEVETEDGTAVIHLGAGAGADEVYARVEERDGLFVIPAYFSANLRKRLVDLRDLRPLRFDLASARSLRIARSGSELSFGARMDGEWNVDPAGAQPPAELDFDPASVQRFVRALLFLRATGVVGDASGDGGGLGQPWATVAVGLADGSAAALEIGRATDDQRWGRVYPARGNADRALYALREQDVELLLQGWPAFRRVAGLTLPDRAAGEGLPEAPGAEVHQPPPGFRPLD